MKTAWSEITAITSAANPKYNTWKKLKTKQPLNQQVILEGERLVFDALSTGQICIDMIIFRDDQVGFQAYQRMQELLALKKPEAKLPLLKLSPYLFFNLTMTKVPQPILLIATLKPIKAPEIRPDQLIAAKQQTLPERFLICENIQDPGNLGTILRTADAFAFDGIILTEKCVQPYNPKCLRASMGSIFHLNIFAFEQTKAAIDWLKQIDISVIAADIKGEALTQVKQETLNQVAIILGNEANGLKKETTQLADKLVLIPMLGQAESLNVAAAAAILLYEFRKTKPNLDF